MYGSVTHYLTVTLTSWKEGIAGAIGWSFFWSLAAMLGPLEPQKRNKTADALLRNARYAVSLILFSTVFAVGESRLFLWKVLGVVACWTGALLPWIKSKQVATVIFLILAVLTGSIAATDAMDRAGAALLVRLGLGTAIGALVGSASGGVVWKVERLIGEPAPPDKKRPQTTPRKPRQRGRR
jgi:hypothetical protein